MTSGPPTYSAKFSAVHVAVVRAHAGLPEQARLGVLPQVEVLLGEGAHRGHARGTRRGGHEDDVLLGHASTSRRKTLPTCWVSRSVFLSMKGNFCRCPSGS